MKDFNLNTLRYWEGEYKEGFYQDRIPHDMKEILKFVDHVFQDMPKSNVIEVACGLGLVSNRIAEHGHKVLGTDFTNNAIIENRKRFSKDNLSFRQLDVLDLNHIFNNIDVIVAFEILEHFKNPEKILRKISNTLSDDGILVFSFPDNRGQDAYMNCHYYYFDYQKTVNMMFMFFDEVRFFKSDLTGNKIQGIAIKHNKVEL